jgi:starch synthase
VSGTRFLEIWHVTREYAGLAEAGGVKDAVQGLAAALSRAGHRISVVLPLYGGFRERSTGALPCIELTLQMPDQDAGNDLRGENVRVLSMDRDGVRVLLVDSPRFAEKKDVYTYTAADEASNAHKKKGTGHWDSHQMNLVLQRTALAAAERLGAPDVFHCHDGHAAFLPAILESLRTASPGLRRSSAILTIHNAGVGYHQEVWDMGFARLVTGLDEDALSPGLLHGTVDPLLLAGRHARLTTVSEQYAAELLAEGEDGMSGGLGPALRVAGVPVTGITNGVDPGPFDPRPGGGALLEHPFDPSRGDWEGKRRGREHLFRLLAPPPAGEGPLFGFIGRLTEQKGIDVLAGALSLLMTAGACPPVLVLGQGAREHEERTQALAEASGGKVRFVPRYDADLARRIYAACDFLVIPSAFEPCGLTDFHAQLMGTIPLVHRVGGLVKVRDSETGFSYEQQTPRALADAILRCIRLSHEKPDLLEEIRRRAFREVLQLHTWDTVSRAGYVPVYESSREDAWSVR